MQAKRRKRPQVCVTLDDKTTKTVKGLSCNAPLGRVLELCLSEHVLTIARKLAATPIDDLEFLSSLVEESVASADLARVDDSLRAGIAREVLKQREAASRETYSRITSTVSLIEKTYRRIDHPVPPYEAIRLATWGALRPLSDLSSGCYRVGSRTVVQIEDFEPVRVWTTRQDTEKASDHVDEWFDCPVSCGEWEDADLKAAPSMVTEMCVPLKSGVWGSEVAWVGTAKAWLDPITRLSLFNAQAGRVAR